MDHGACARAGMKKPMNEAAIRLRVEPLSEGGFLAVSPDVPSLVAEGRSIAEATEIAQGLARKIAESRLERGDPLPRALAAFSESSAAIDLRIPVSVP